MATDREAARRQRLRGAQTREPQNIDFAFTLPAPPPPVPAARITRSGATPSPNRAVRTTTPATRGEGADNGRKRAAPPTAGNDGGEKRQRVGEFGEGLPVIDDHTEIDVPSAGLEDVAEEVLATALALAQENMTPERAVDELDELSSIFELPQTSSRRSRSSRIELDILEEVAESPMHAPGSGQRRTLSPYQAQAQNARLRDVMGTPSRLPMDDMEADELLTSGSGGILEQTHTIASPELERRPGTATATPRAERRQEDDDEIDELSPDQPTTLRAEERYSDEEEAEEPEEASDDEEDEEASEILDAEAAQQLQSRRRQRSIALEEDSPEGSEAEPDISPAARAQTSGKRLPAQHPPPKASPAQQRAPKARMTAPKPKPSKPTKKASAAAAKKQGGAALAGPRSTELIPVTAYRMTRPPAPAPSDSEDDILSAPIPFAARSGVNAVDVLAQVCDEMLSGASAALEQGAQRAAEDGGAAAAAERREYRTKQRAVEAWGEAVRARLLELTVALDAEYGVRKRVRAAVREKVELRGELLRIRAEREAVALRMDGVRVRHEEEGGRAETLTSLSTTLHDIALAASLGRDAAAAGAATSPPPPSEPPLPALLEQVAALASNKSTKGGLLKRLKEFNGFLERVAGAVEGR